MKNFLTGLIALVLPFCVFAQHEGHGMMGGTDVPEQKTENFNFVCPMHPEVVSDNPGTCVKCGMDLEQKKIAEVKSSTDKVYFNCPDHPSVKKGKKGRCSDCGKKLRKRKIYTYN